MFDKCSFIGELFSLDGEYFIIKAYQLILGRHADPAGFAHYKRLLKKSGSRAKVASDLLCSDEGRAHPHWREMKSVIRKQRYSEIFSFKQNSCARAIGSDDSFEPMPLSQPMSEMLAIKINQTLLEKVGQIRDHLMQIEHRLDVRQDQRSGNSLGKKKTRYLFNLSTSNHWRAHPVEIVRVERELARYLRRFDNVDFVIWDAASKSLYALGSHQVDHILSDQWCEAGDGVASYQIAALSIIEITSEHTYISVGLDWDHAPTSDVVEYLRRLRVKLILACYDTVPIKFPEFCVRETMQQEFSKHLVDMGHGADKVFAISQSTKHDLLKFWDEAGIECDPPHVFTVPLGSYAQASKLPTLTEYEAAVVEDVFRKGEYVLYVSSVEPRKNHRLLLDIWRDRWHERGKDCPQFVHVGMVGWGSHDLVQRIPRMPAYINGKINGLQHIGDNLLAHLYHNASFTVFPSLYEGWGLAANESLAFGKVCVIANNSALPEAAQNLMPAYHPLDFFGWKNEIDRLLDDIPYRHSLERKISEDYQHISWTDFGRSFCEHLVMENQNAE